jgi:transglutaminase-like putative cysteine protease
MMRLGLRHVAGFHYGGRVNASYNEARLLPVDSDGQQVLSSKLTIRPRASQFSYTDYFGTQVTVFEVLTPHTELTVEATCLAEVDRAAPVVSALPWDQIAAKAGAATRLVEYSRQTGRTDPVAEVRELARSHQGDDPHESAMAICQAIRERMEYVQGVTGVNSTAAEAWAAGKGVCQDITHIALGALRFAGIPARYVSGYLHPDRQPEVGKTVGAESHAWVEYFVGDWVGFDPTNLIPIEDRHLMVARGRDYDDIAPIRGVYSGEGASEMFVTVEITRLA